MPLQSSGAGPTPLGMGVWPASAVRFVEKAPGAALAPTPTMLASTRSRPLPSSAAAHRRSLAACEIRSTTHAPKAVTRGRVHFGSSPSAVTRPAQGINASPLMSSEADVHPLRGVTAASLTVVAARARRNSEAGPFLGTHTGHDSGHRDWLARACHCRHGAPTRDRVDDRRLSADVVGPSRLADRPVRGVSGTPLSVRGART